MKKHKPLVSIISGYYNRVNYVEESIQSLCNQTYDNIEIIIFDDCSTDGTYEKLLEFENKDSRVKILKHEINKGFVRGLIEAINTSKGEFIAIHGSGDFSYPTRIEKQVEVLIKNYNIGLIGCIVQNSMVVNGVENISLFHYKIHGNALSVLKEKNIFTHGEVMFRRSIYDIVGGYREYFYFAQDYDLWTRMAYYCDFFSIDEILYKRFLRSDGATVRPEKRLVQAINTEIIQQNINFIEKNEKDLIDLYGDKAFVKINRISSIGQSNLYSRINEVFHTYHKLDEKSLLVLRKLILYSNIKVLGVLLYVFYHIIPYRFSRKIVNRRKFKRMINFCYNELF